MVILPAAMAFPMAPLPILAMVAATYVRTVAQCPGSQSPNRFVCAAANPAIQLNPRLRQRRLSPCPNAAANNRLCPQPAKKPRQRPVTAPGSVHYLLPKNHPVLHLVNLKLLCVPKMLKNHPVFISYRNPHDYNTLLPIISVYPRPTPPGRHFSATIR